MKSQAQFKSLALYWLGAMLFVAGVFCICKYFQAAPITVHPQIAARITASELRFDITSFEARINADSYFNVPWQTSLSGLVGSIGSVAYLAERIYVVRKGDQLGRIARAHGLKGWGALYHLNRKTIGGNPDLIQPGQVLLIPVQFASIPSRASEHIGRGKTTVISFANCVVCHGQVAHSAGTIDCTISHHSQHVASATVQAKRSVTLRRAARSPSRINGVAQWAKENVDPFGEKRDPIRAINLLPIDNVLKSMLVLSYQQPSEPFMLMPGQDINFLLFGNYKWISNARWVGSYPLSGEAWPPVTHDGKTMRLARTFACFNLEIITVKQPEAPVLRMDPPPADNTVTAPPADNVAPPPADNVVTAMPPPVKDERPPLGIPLPLPKPGELKYSCGWDPDFEWPVYGGFSRGIHGDSLLRYGGTVFTFYPAACNKEASNYRVGPSFSMARWDFTKNQRTGGEFQLEGKNALAGVKGEYIDPERKVEVEARYGTQQYEYHSSTNPKDRTVSDKHRLFLGITYSRYGYDDNAAVTLLQGGISTEQDMGGTVNKGQNVRESIYTIRGRVEGRHYGDYTPIGDLPLDYSQGPKVFGAHPAAGFKYKTFAEFLVGISANLNNGTGDNTRGVKTFDGKASIDLDRLFKYLLNPEAYGRGSDYEPPPLTDGEE